MLAVRRQLSRTKVLATLVTFIVLGAGIAYAAARAAEPSRNEARSYAHRTWIRQKHLGKRHFRLFPGDASQSVTANDGSRLTAYGIVLKGTADGAGQAVLLFHNDHFVRWASPRITLKLGISGRRGKRILVRYAVYRGRDAICCPRDIKKVTYRWNGSRIIPSGKAPKVWGKRLERLHLGRR